MTLTSKSSSPQSQAMLRTLQEAVSKNLEKKRRLGQYAVTWQDGRPLLTGGDKPEVVPQLVEVTDVRPPLQCE